MSRYIPNHPNANQVFDLGAKFKTEALLNGKSIFVPKADLWTPENFDPLIEHYVKDPIVGKGDVRGEKFWEKLGSQLGRCTPSSVALCAEIYWILTLASSFLTVKYKKSKISSIWAMARPEPISSLDASSPYLSETALGGVGSTGTAYNLLMWMELAYAIQMFRSLVAMPIDERSKLLMQPWEFARWLDEMDDTEGRQFYHILAHVLFPDEFERVFSEGGKEALARHDTLSIPHARRSPRSTRDKALFDERVRLEREFGRSIDYYSDPPLLVRKDKSKQKRKSVSPSPRGIDLTELFTDSNGGDSNKQAQEGGGDSPIERPWTPRNRVFFGPPGSGKTYSMERIRLERYKSGEHIVFVSFHPSYSYEDFVEGYRPLPGQGGRLSERPVKGPFREICERAHKHPDVRHTLFIDEINRANVAKVFGELITILEPSKRCDPNPTLDFSDVNSAVRLQYSGEMLAVPANLDIVATMNTADRSVQSIDRALRRRFEFIETPSDPERLSPNLVGGVDLRALLSAVNDRIEFLIDSDHAIGHALLMDVRSLSDLRRVFSRRVIPLLQEYFFEDLSKAKLALTGSGKRSVFFDERPLDPGKLFDSTAELDGLEARVSIRPASRTDNWTAPEFVKLYLRGAEAQAAIDALSSGGLPDQEVEDDEEIAEEWSGAKLEDIEPDRREGAASEPITEISAASGVKHGERSSAPFGTSSQAPVDDTDSGATGQTEGST
ncbi:McrB family protein [Paraburkholderia sabiae]|uniref:AAA family ATPase n=1 Tax=Paraburkholderia sabiae TaxID=273251 RepID=A0ABU9QPH1_9BURK|nr:AAA family ATPase [Paraburkholderia sabiae]WJZ74372.1 AAA family ATPase [Paraburkholderia sabiae]CAD6562579.1 hypothetical protein LMG24235_07818 [Paraburkholderia sabiae]